MKTNNRQKMAELAYELRGCIFELHKEIGPGLLETVYERLLTHLLVEKGIKVRNQVPIPLIYKGIKLDQGFRADIIVEDKILIEIKSVEAIHEVHFKQVLTYLKLTGISLGYLVNFNSSFIKDKESLFRIVNNY